MLLRRFLSICGPVIPNREQIFTQQAQLHENICINTLIRSHQTMWCACMFGSAHGLWLCFQHLDSDLCFSLCPLVFNTAVRPPALNSSVFCFFFGCRLWTTLGIRRLAGWPDWDLERCTSSRYGSVQGGTIVKKCVTKNIVPLHAYRRRFIYIHINIKTRSVCFDNMAGIFILIVGHLGNTVPQLWLRVITKHQWCKHLVRLTLSRCPALCGLRKRHPSSTTAWSRVVWWRQVSIKMQAQTALDFFGLARPDISRAQPLRSSL